MPRRPATAVMWTRLLVEPPIAIRIRKALAKARGVMMRSGVNPAAAMATARAPAASPWRRRSAATAGIAAPPGSIMPSASVMQAIVLAVPITMQVPAVGASWPPTASISAASSSPARCIAQKRRQSVQAPRRSPRWLPVSSSAR